MKISACVAAITLAFSAAHAWTFDATDVAPSEDVAGEHQPLQRSWTISSIAQLEQLYLALPGRVFVELDASLLPAVKTPKVPGVVPGVTPGVETGVIPGEVPGFVPGAVPDLPAKKTPDTETPATETSKKTPKVPGVEPGVTPGVETGVIPGAVPGFVPGEGPASPAKETQADAPAVASTEKTPKVPGVEPGVTPGAETGVIPGAVPGFVPGEGPATPAKETQADAPAGATSKKTPKVPGVEPGVTPGVETGVIPGAVPGFVPGEGPAPPVKEAQTAFAIATTEKTPKVPGVKPGVTPGVETGVVPGAVPGFVPGVGAELQSLEAETEVFATKTSSVGASEIPGVVSGQTPGVVPGFIPGVEPGFVPGTVPDMAVESEAFATKKSKGTPGVVAGFTPGEAPGFTPGEVPGFVPGAVPNVLATKAEITLSEKTKTPGVVAGFTPGEVPGFTPGEVPGFVPGAVPNVPATKAEVNLSDEKTPKTPGVVAGFTPGKAPGFTPGEVPGFVPGSVPANSDAAINNRKLAEISPIMLRKHHKTDEDEDAPQGEETIVARIVISGNSTELLNMIEAVPLHRRRNDGLKLHLKNDDAYGEGYVLTQIYLYEKNLLRRVTSAFTGDVILNDDVVTVNDPEADVMFACVGDSNLFFQSASNATLSSLEVEVTGNGLAQLTIPAVNLEGQLDVEVAGSGTVAIVTDAVVATDVKTTLSGSGNIVVDTNNLAAATLKASVYGSGVTSLAKAGSVEKESLTLSGSGQLLAGSIMAVKSDVDVWGDGEMLVQVSDKLTVSTSAWGKVGYVNAPPTDVKIKGWWFWREASAIVYPEAVNRVLIYESVPVPAKYPVYFSIETVKSVLTNDPDYAFVSVKTTPSVSELMTMSLSNEESTGSYGIGYAFVGVGVVVVNVVAARSWAQRRARRHYTRLL